VDLHGRCVVVLGGTSGIGLATARLAADAGARVVVAGRDPERAARAAADLGCTGVPADVLDDDALRRVFEAAGTVDHLVQAAGDISGGPIATTPIERLRPALDVRLWGAIRAVRAATGHLAPDASVTFVSGTVSTRPVPGAAVSAASAAGVEALARALALELAPVRVNAVCPGVVDTPLLDRPFGDRRAAALEQLASRLPVGRVGRSHDVAHAVLFLATNGYVTGEVLHVDGGGRLV
jgi:NAD(P)-dependent dehydrogenase (short-subunit alcohol dehydrogenase family)